MNRVLFSIVTFLVTVPTVLANTPQKKLYEQAWQLFLDRERGVETTRNCVSTARRAANAAVDAGDKEVQFEAFILESRCLYYEGMLVPEAETPNRPKMAVHERGMNAAKEALKVEPNRAEGHYYLAINHGRYGLAAGVDNVLEERTDLKRAAETAMRKKAIIDGKTVVGREIDCWGPARTLGWMYFKLPITHDGNKAAALDLLGKAYENCNADPKKKQYPNSLNVIYYSTVLVDRGQKEKAKQVLDELIRFEGNPAAYNPERVPETRMDIRDAKIFRKSLGN
ncbi:MAG: hypothetical protein AB1540_00495 [Bdellovibrionota bacterium]